MNSDDGLADSVGSALLTALSTLPPAERLAFVLHVLLGLPYREIAPLLNRSPAATRRLVTRARHHMTDAKARGGPTAGFL
ncbi:sigma factor-like helix-turn-helix DNA-binding protein [Nonomuraea sp. NPDC050790]|uniref:sigma factor-like helix-turn-helix DNA-binding protein n=1 Tax=Nonomuraea sp. NPDC050790 TaxID=3364371 RepID=UPI0037BDF7DD